ncbi:uncharacterized protein LOC120631749 [Pararge aegeria]|uniref:Jg2749 protein n=1 Tax=Pararge aegeria aegeria TaxID=348720 RepID=A0A8S4RCA9_9NEOP|nr:uncharacterized protein LOC120631749 [Pararge aegeria]CAH2233213.1 jg2749 [Pararge aegeria aegeria]
MCDPDQSAVSVHKRHSCYTTFSSERTSSHVVCKSDANVYYTSRTETDSYTRSKDKSSGSNCEYYKNYEHDEMPVKDDTSFNDHSFSEDNEMRSGDHKDSITNSDLDKLELKLLSKMSRELQTDDDVSSLDSNIKLFKTTVQEIFDNFYNNMQDFELYKKKFNEILTKNKGDSFSEMEDFIRDMIQSIGSSKSLISDKNIAIAHKNVDMSDKMSKENKINVNNMGLKVSKKMNSTLETFLNENYLTDSTFEDHGSKCKPGTKAGDTTFNFDRSSYTTCTEVKMPNRDMLSEINIREKNIGMAENQAASADNIQKLAAKKLQIENYVKLQQDCRTKDRDRNIPVKIASVKKNIHLDEDFIHEAKEEETKFFIFRICNYICKKFRKNSVG